MSIGDAAQSRGDIMRRLHELERQIQEMQAGSRLGSTSFQEPGKIRYLDRDGTERLIIGRSTSAVDPSVSDVNVRYRSGPATKEGGEVGIGTIFSNDDGQILGHGLYIQTEAGADIVRIHTLDNSRRVQLRSVEGAQVWVEDEGMARPRMPVHWAVGQSGDLIADGNQLRGAAEGYPIATWPHLRYVYRVTILSGNPTVQVRLRAPDEDEVLVDFQSWTVGGYQTVDVDLSSWGHLIRRLVRLEAEVTAGTGQARVSMVGGWVGEF